MQVRGKAIVHKEMIGHARLDVVTAINNLFGDGAKVWLIEMTRSGERPLPLDDVVDNSIPVIPGGLDPVTCESRQHFSCGTGEPLATLDRARGHQRQRLDPVAVLQGQALGDTTPHGEPDDVRTVDTESVENCYGVSNQIGPGVFGLAGRIVG